MEEARNNVDLVKIPLMISFDHDHGSSVTEVFSDPRVEGVNINKILLLGKLSTFAPMFISSHLNRSN